MSEQRWVVIVHEDGSTESSLEHLTPTIELLRQPYDEGAPTQYILCFAGFRGSKQMLRFYRHPHIDQRCAAAHAWEHTLEAAHVAYGLGES